VGQANQLTESAADESRASLPTSLLWQAVGRQKLRMVLGVLAVLSAAVLYHQLKGPWYVATAEVLVLKKQLDTSPISGPNVTGHVLEDYLPTHMVIISSPRVVREAVTKGDLVSLEGLQRDNELSKLVRTVSRSVFGEGPKGPPEDALTQAICGSLSATSQAPRPGASPSREMLEVSFEGKEPHDCGKVLEAVIASYHDFLKDAYRNVNAETLELLARARDASQKDLEVKEVAYREFRRRATPLLRGKDGNGTSVYQERLALIHARRSALRLRQAEISDALSAIEKALKSGRDYADLLELVSVLPANRDILTSAPEATIRGGTGEVLSTNRGGRETLEEQLVNLQLEERKLLLSGYGPAHPQVAAIRDRIEGVRGLIAPSSEARPPEPGQKEWVEGFVKLKVRLLEQEFRDNQRTDQSLAPLFDRDQKEAKEAVLTEIEDESHRAGIERSKLLNESIVKRFQEIDTVKEYGGYDTHVLAPPAGKLLLKKYFLIFGGASLLGLLVGVGWGCVAETRDKSFRTSQEVSQRLGLPVVGHIPVLRPGWKPRKTGHRGANLDPLISTYHEPDSPKAEAYRGIRTILYYADRPEPKKLIQITSPCQGDGKTTLAANLAVCIAQSGKKVLVIEADLRRPRLHKAFGLESTSGLSLVLAGEVEPAAAVQQTCIPGLLLLSAGPRPTNPAELLTSPRLKEVLEGFGQVYDFVLVDTPPVLTLTDASAVAPWVHGVILTVRNSKNCRPQAEQALQMLDAVGAKVLGVVLNAVGRQFNPTVYGYQDSVRARA
jgi:polysaccharide biosynthesis transport protein